VGREVASRCDTFLDPGVRWWPMRGTGSRPRVC